MNLQRGTVKNAPKVPQPAVPPVRTDILELMAARPTPVKVAIDRTVTVKEDVKHERMSADYTRQRIAILQGMNK